MIRSRDAKGRFVRHTAPRRCRQCHLFSRRGAPCPTPRREVVKEAAVANREDFKDWLKDCVRARLRFAGMRVVTFLF
jgi:hypothetical protein